MSRLEQTIKQGLERSDLIITTGGLGPTDDDLTKEGVAAALGLKLIPHQESLDRIESYFRASNRPMAQCNLKQGYIPEGSKALENNNGTAPGILVENNGKIVVLLPGPPKEMIPMFDQSVYPYLKAKSDYIISSRTLRVIRVGESTIQELLQPIFDSQTNPTVAPYAKDSEVHLRITAKCSDEKEAESLLKDMELKISGILGENIYGYDDESLEQVVYRLLKAKNMTVSFAESCTGGMISGRLTNVSGASDVFMDSIVTYSNQAKMKFLNVKKETLEKFGAVSPETAREMAEGIKLVSGTDVGISVTGIAGPNGGTPEKPVGLFYIGLAVGNKVEAFKFLFPSSREKVRWHATTQALDILRRELL